VKVKEYIDNRARAAQVNNTGVGKVITVAKNGRHTVELDGGRRIMVFSATGENYNPGDTVSIRYLSGDKRQAEIAGKTTRRLATAVKRVSR
jgi:translation initiation factor IF-1